MFIAAGTPIAPIQGAVELRAGGGTFFSEDPMPLPVLGEASEGLRSIGAFVPSPGQHSEIGVERRIDPNRPAVSLGLATIGRCPRVDQRGARPA